MLANDHSAPWAHPSDMRAQDLPLALRSDDAELQDEGGTGLFAVFDQFLDRMPAWPFHAIASLTALTGLWFALALLGGLPRGVVEWIAMGMFGLFAYAVGFMIALLAAWLIGVATRASVLLLMLAGGVAVWGLVALQGTV
ncbi:hypothetical protein P6F26_08980 [Roseibacterium sp. SDUM158017]|uniref:hypothetical protein n=1 Tax=Roseicyclus salinarum TaxID=3036773 RepID=UPI002414E4EF|nr:hypothetical protein [Roseibacterium sp. SDUM158017]MDG4648578.1 hypothetical protein [Roseibacterium sp. SDUM158017]